VDSAGAQSDGDSSTATLSADGRYVVFQSGATNLVPDDTNGVYDIFLRDRQTGATERISVDTAGNQADGLSSGAAVSADGRYVAYGSAATNLAPDDTNGLYEIFVRDRQTGTTQRVSVDSSGAEANGQSYNVAISGDGAHVAFASAAGNLVPGDTNAKTDIFIHDRQASTTERVSVDGSGNEADGDSDLPAISADGRYVAFDSIASNLAPADTNDTNDVFVRDRQTGSTTRVSVDSLGNQGDGGSHAPDLSADGRYAVFESYTTNLVPADTNGFEDIFVHDLQAGSTERLSVDSMGHQGDDDSYAVTISGAGRYAAFESHSTNLVPGDTNGEEDVFVHDRGELPTPTPTLEPTPTPTGGATLIQGNVDCSGGDPDAVDGLKELRHVAGLPVSQTEPCPDIGTNVASVWGDVDCDGDVDSVDALKILRFVAALSVAQTEPCPDIGTPEGG
jgi:Tol biopolymer transport system component